MLTREPMGAELPRQDTRNHPQDFSFCGLRSGCGSTSSGLGVLEDAFTTPCPIAHGDGRPNCCRLGRDPRAFPGRECSPRGSRIARRVRFLVLFLPSAPPPHTRYHPPLQFKPASTVPRRGSPGRPLHRPHRASACLSHSFCLISAHSPGLAGPLLTRCSLSPPERAQLSPHPRQFLALGPSPPTEPLSVQSHPLPGCFPLSGRALLSAPPWSEPSSCKPRGLHLAQLCDRIPRSEHLNVPQVACGSGLLLPGGDSRSSPGGLYSHSFPRLASRSTHGPRLGWGYTWTPPCAPVHLQLRALGLNTWNQLVPFGSQNPRTSL